MGSVYSKYLRKARCRAMLVIGLLSTISWMVGFFYVQAAASLCDVSKYELSGTLIDRDVNTVMSLRCVNGEPHLVFSPISKNHVLYKNAYHIAKETRRKVLFGDAGDTWVRQGAMALPSLSTKSTTLTILLYACRRDLTRWVCGNQSQGGSRWQKVYIRTSGKPLPASKTLGTSTRPTFTINNSTYGFIQEPITEYRGEVRVLLGGVAPREAELVFQSTELSKVVSVGLGDKDGIGVVSLPATVLPGIYELLVRNTRSGTYVGHVDPFVVYDADARTKPTITRVTRRTSKTGADEYEIIGSGFSRVDNVVHVGVTALRAMSEDGTTLRVPVVRQMIQGITLEGTETTLDISAVADYDLFIIVKNELGSSDPYTL